MIVAHLTPTPCLLDRLGRLDRDLVVGLVAVLDAEVVIEQVDVEIGQDQPLADPLPDDPGHLVAVELDDRVLHLDLGHGPFLRFSGSGRALGRAQCARQPRRIVPAFQPL